MKLATLPDGGELAFEIHGPEHGPTLLLVRPLGGSMASWADFSDRLARDIRLVMFDGRGTGRSGPAPWSLTTRSMARDAKALLDVLEIPKAHVYGISLGGMVSSWLAVDHPEKVDRLVLASAVPMGTMFRPQAIGRGLSVAGCLTQSAPLAEACMATRILSHHFREQHPDEVERIRKRAAQFPATHRALGILLAAAARHDVGRHLPEIAAETLVLHGEHDPLLTEQSQGKLLQGIPSVTFDTIVGAGHDISAEAPEIVAERVLKHLGIT